MSNINLPFDIEKILRELIEQEIENIRRFKKPKHKEPSLTDALNYYMYKRRMQINFCKTQANKIIQSNNIDEIKEIAKEITKVGV